jgi:CubicO group peptidase (beta-lactamase class C family)
MSKQFTAVAILLLEQDGKLKTSDLISLYLPDFKPDAPITIEQLLTAIIRER